MHHPPRTLALLVIATSIAAYWLASVAEAQSQHGTRAGAHRGGGHQASAISTRAPLRPSGYQPRGPARPGFGTGLSAANVRPGFYRHLDAPKHQGGRGGRHGHGHGHHAVPVYVYPTYFPETFYPTAPVFSEPEPPQAPAPVEPQIYIVTPPVAAAPPVQTAATTQPAQPIQPPRSTDPGEIRFSVLPADARVYLDDEFLGTGAELAALEEAQLYPPGVHVLEVTHPDYRSQRLVFGVSDSDPAHVLIDLSADRLSRRTRVK